MLREGRTRSHHSPATWLTFSPILIARHGLSCTVNSAFSEQPGLSPPHRRVPPDAELAGHRGDRPAKLTDLPCRSARVRSVRTARGAYPGGVPATSGGSRGRATPACARPNGWPLHRLGGHGAGWPDGHRTWPAAHNHGRHRSRRGPKSRTCVNPRRL